MKPLYIIILLFAVFITCLSDGISWALAPIPGIGFVLGFAIACCINATMGAGLLFLLALNGMWHPRIGPFALVGGLLPGLNFLPFWVGLVIAGIVYKMNAEGENLGGVTSLALKLQSAYTAKNPLASMKGAAGIDMSERRATGRPQRATNDNAEPPIEGSGQQEKSRAPIDLKSPSINSDISRAPRQPYAQAA